MEKIGEAAACAVKRTHLDTRMAHAAARLGADLKEEFEVTFDVAFDKESGLWTVPSADVSNYSPAVVELLYPAIHCCTTSTCCLWKSPGLHPDKQLHIG